MRDPRRIKPMLRLIEEVWTKYPDLRLGQLIDNACAPNSANVFYVEDAVIAAGLYKFITTPK